MAGATSKALALFEAMLDVSAEERPLWLDGACEGNLPLRDAVLRLAAAADRTGSGLQTGPSPPPENTHRPETVGVYRLTARIGEGGMGEVWRAERNDGVFERAVAVKFLRSQLPTPQAVALFDRERRAMARLSHPAIAQIIDGGTQDNAPYLVMELVEGPPIDEWAQGRPAKDVARALSAVCAGVAYAHDHGVVHADIKPSNILMTPEGAPKLVDFGVAQLAHDAASGPTPFTRRYASPERLAGAAPSAGDDVFALGVLLRALTPASDADLAAIAGKATLAPAARYASVAGLREDLERWLEDRPVSALPASTVHATRLFIRRRPFTAAGASAAALALLVAGGVSLGFYARGETARHQAEARYGDARALAHYQLYDVYDGLVKQAGTTETRYRVAQEAQRFLNKMIDEGGRRADVAVDAAAGLIRLAEIMGVPGAPNMGEPEAARANLLRADTLLADQPGPGAAIERARAQSMLAAIALWTDGKPDEASRRTALAMHELEGVPDTAAKREAWFMARWRDTEIADMSERYDQSAALAKGTLAALDTWPPAEHDGAWLAQAHARLLMKLGDATWYTVGKREGLDTYRRVDALLSAALRDAPNHTSLLLLSLQNGYNIATSMDELGDHAGAVRMLRERVRTGERLVQLESRDANLRRTLWVIKGGLSQILADTGHIREALAVQEEEVTLADQRLTAQPTLTGPKRDAAFSRLVRGKLSWQAGDHKGACADWTAAHTTFTELKAQDALGAFDVNHNLTALKAALDVCAGRATPSAFKFD